MKTQLFDYESRNAVYSIDCINCGPTYIAEIACLHEDMDNTKSSIRNTSTLSNTLSPTNAAYK